MAVPKRPPAKQIDESLKRLQTDHVDLLQFHETIRMEDPDRFFAPGGALEAFEDARKAGKIRFIGFTGHKDPSVHLRMLDVAQRPRASISTPCCFPPMSWTGASAASCMKCCPSRIKDGIAVQTMKPMGGGFILKSGVATPTECLQYALSQPVSVVIHGMDKLEYLEHSLGVVKNFHPLTGQQIAVLGEKAKQAASSGQYELFKTTNHFDSTAKNPAWVG